MEINSKRIDERFGIFSCDLWNLFDKNSLEITPSSRRKRTAFVMIQNLQKREGNSKEKRVYNIQKYFSIEERFFRGTRMKTLNTS
jgi:hypothetical protein